MSEFSSRVDYMLAEQGIKRADLCRGTGIGESTVRGWVKFNPSYETAVKVADFLGVSAHWLFTGEESKDIEYEVNQEEKNLVEFYRDLSPKERRLIRGLIQNISSASQIKKESIYFLLDCIVEKLGSIENRSSEDCIQ